MNTNIVWALLMSAGLAWGEDVPLSELEFQPSAPVTVPEKGLGLGVTIFPQVKITEWSESIVPAQAPMTLYLPKFPAADPANIPTGPQTAIRFVPPSEILNTQPGLFLSAPFSMLVVIPKELDPYLAMVPDERFTDVGTVEVHSMRLFPYFPEAK